MCTHAHTPTSCLPQTRDLKFDEMKQRVLSLEALLRTMVKDIQSWQDEMQVCTSIFFSVFFDLCTSVN